jgi:hypothetical protein
VRADVGTMMVFGLPASGHCAFPLRHVVTSPGEQSGNSSWTQDVLTECRSEVAVGGVSGSAKKGDSVRLLDGSQGAVVITTAAEHDAG